MKSLSSNLLKRGSTFLSSDNTRVINTDELMAARLEALAFKAVVTPPEEILPGNAPMPDDVMRLLADDEEAEAFEGLNAPVVSVLNEEELTRASEQAQELITDAQAQAEEILRAANAEAETIRANAAEAGRNQGLADGRAQAQIELQQKMDEYNQLGAALEEEYNEKIDQAEVALVDALVDIFEHVFRVNFSEKTQVLLYLLRSTIKKSPNCKQYVIRVGSVDYPEVEENAMELRSLLIGNNPVLEVLEDSTLSEGQCMVEVDNGIFDCGIDTTLKELGLRLRELSYERN